MEKGTFLSHSGSLAEEINVDLHNRPFSICISERCSCGTCPCQETMALPHLLRSWECQVFGDAFRPADVKYCGLKEEVWRLGTFYVLLRSGLAGSNYFHSLSYSYWPFVVLQCSADFLSRLNCSCYSPHHLYFVFFYLSSNLSSSIELLSLNF